MEEEKQLNIHQKILGIMSELDYIAKGDKTVNGAYRFVSHDQVTAKVHPMLVKYRVSVIPTIEEVKQEGNRTEVKLITSFVNADNPQDNFAVRSIGYGIDGSDKGPGKAISYAYKYALLKTFCLETGDDPDNDSNAAYEPAKCQEFESLVPFEINMLILNKFLEHSAAAMGKHVEDVKREAIKRMPDFLQGFEKWCRKQKEKA